MTATTVLTKALLHHQHRKRGYAAYLSDLHDEHTRNNNFQRDINALLSQNGIHIRPTTTPTDAITRRPPISSPLNPNATSSPAPIPFSSNTTYRPFIKPGSHAWAALNPTSTKPHDRVTAGELWNRQHTARVARDLHEHHRHVTHVKAIKARLARETEERMEDFEKKRAVRGKWAIERPVPLPQRTSSLWNDGLFWDDGLQETSVLRPISGNEVKRPAVAKKAGRWRRQRG